MKWMAMRLGRLFRAFAKKLQPFGAAVLLGFGFVFAQLQATLAMLLRSASPKGQYLPLPNVYSFSSNARISIRTVGAAKMNLDSQFVHHGSFDSAGADGLFFVRSVNDLDMI